MEPNGIRTGQETRTVHRGCHLCEATCGLTLTMQDDEVLSVRGDDDDVFSKGYLCPKGVAVKDLHHDPDRLRSPMIRRGDRWAEASWDAAFAEIEARLRPLLAEHGGNSVAVYYGNPTAHDAGSLLYNPVLARALGTDYRFSASTVDQMPKHVSSGLMFGTKLTIPIPDVDRTDYLLVLGANPLVSNGSLFTAPDMPRRLKALRERGGRLVVVDPRRSRTADAADEWVPIRPATDALFLAAIAQTLVEEGLVDLGHLAPHVVGLPELATAVSPYRPEVVAAACGIPAETIRRIARELAAAPSAAVYGRIGTCTTEYGTVASWLVDVLNVLTGNLDRPGGAMFPRAAAGAENTQGEPGRGRGVRIPGSRQTRVRGVPSTYGEFPVATLAEEIDTPGPDGERVRALFTVAGNPARSTPNSGRLEKALASLDLMVSIDIYLNETTRHADVILPAPSVLTRSHYDLSFYQLSVRNVVRWSPPLVALGPDELSQVDILLRLAAIASGTTPDQVDDVLVLGLAREATGDPHSPVHGRDPAELVAQLTGRRDDRGLDLLLRVGPYGDAFGARPGGLSLATLQQAPHGIDLGPLEPRVPEVLRTPSGKVELAPPQLVADIERLDALLVRHGDGQLTLVGRRDLRSNNSWMHNVPHLVKGRDRCVLHVHPVDAERLGLADGSVVRVASRAGAIDAPVVVTDEVSQGVVSLPHGWGHDGVAMTVAAAHTGVNSNALTDEVPLDPLSGNAVLNGIPVSLVPV
jgi:anaerobic selenocysteine-containing dehydrogenase